MNVSAFPQPPDDVLFVRIGEAPPNPSRVCTTLLYVDARSKCNKNTNKIMGPKTQTKNVTSKHRKQMILTYIIS